MRSAIFAGVIFAIIGYDYSSTWAQERQRPRLLEGSVFHIGDPLGSTQEETDRSISAIAFAPDGKHLMIGDTQGWLTEVETRHGKKTNAGKLHGSEIREIVFRPGQSSYFTLPAQGKACEWLSAGRKRLELPVNGRASCLSMAVSLDGKKIALSNRSYKESDSLQIVDSESGKQLISFRAGAAPESLAFSEDGDSLLCISEEEGCLQLWNLAAKELVWSRREPRAYAGSAIDVRFLSGVVFGADDEDYFYSIDNPWGDADVCRCETKTGRILREFSSKQGHIKFAVSPDGRWLAIGGYDAFVELWDLTTNKLARQFAGDQDRIWCLAFSPDSRTLASGGGDGSVVVWEVAGERQR